jgi:hypothetical protein
MRRTDQYLPKFNIFILYYLILVTDACDVAAEISSSELFNSVGARRGASWAKGALTHWLWHL